MKMRSLAAVLAGLLAGQGLLARAADAPGPGSRLAYTVKIDPAGRKVHVTMTVAGHPTKQVTRFTSFGLRKKVKIGRRTVDGALAFGYQIPIDQDAFGDPFQPVLGKDHFAGFLSKVLLAPRIDGVTFRDILLTIDAPKGWKVASWKAAAIRAATCIAASPSVCGSTSRKLSSRSSPRWSWSRVRPATRAPSLARASSRSAWPCRSTAACSASIRISTQVSG